MGLPVQKQIDELGGSKSISAWEAQFKLACEKCKDENVTLVGGVAPPGVVTPNRSPKIDASGLHGYCKRKLSQRPSVRHAGDQT